MVTLTIAYFFFGKKDEDNFDWDDDFDPIFTSYRLPEISEKDKTKIKEVCLKKKKRNKTNKNQLS